MDLWVKVNPHKSPFPINRPCPVLALVLRFSYGTLHTSKGYYSWNVDGFDLQNPWLWPWPTKPSWTSEHAADIKGTCLWVSKFSSLTVVNDAPDRQVLKISFWQISWLSNLSGPMVQHNCHAISISTHPLPVYSSFLIEKDMNANIQCLLSFSIKKEIHSGEGCVEMDIPWQLSRTIGPLTLHSAMFPRREKVLPYSLWDY